MKACRILTMVFVCLTNLDAFADWSCVSRSGTSYTSEERVMDDACIRVESAAERAAAEKEEKKPFKSKPLEAKKTLEAGKATVLNTLKDPDSTKFRGLFTSKDLILCGELNSKNSMGGYVGFTRFVTIPHSGFTRIDDGDESFQYFWLRACKGFTKTEIEALKN